MSDEPTTPSESNPTSDESEPTPEELHKPGSDSEQQASERQTHPINELHGPPRGARGIAQHERASEMVRLRVMFVPDAEIANRFGISPGRVRAIVARELKSQRAKNAAEYRDLFGQRYEELARPYIRDAFGWTERHPEEHPQAGEVKKVHPPELKAAEFVLKCINEARKLQGLEKITIEYEGATQEERAAGLAGQLRAYLLGVEDGAGAADGSPALSASNGDSAPPTPSE